MPIPDGGEPLPPYLRRYFEPRVDRDLSDVRLHRDATAGEMARSVDARAYALGRHIVLGRDQYRPDLPAGRRLLAHEVAHVVRGDAEQTVRREDLVCEAPEPGELEQDLVCEGPDPESLVCEVPELPPPPPPSTAPGLSTEDANLVRQMRWLPALQAARAVALQARRMRERNDSQAFGTGPGIGVFPGLTRGARRTWSPGMAHGVRPGILQAEREANARLREALNLVDLEDEREIGRIEARFGALFKRKALEIANHMLDQSESLAREEVGRYEAVPTGGRATDPTLSGLRAAARRIEPFQRDLVEAMEAAAARGNAAMAAYGGPQGPSAIAPREIPTYIKGSVFQSDGLVRLAYDEYDRQRQEVAREYPVLASEGLDYGAIVEMPRDRLRSSMIGRSNEVLSSVAEAREDLNDDHDKVWDLDPVLGRTAALLGVAPGTPGDQVWRSLKAAHERSELFIDLFLAAAAIALAVAAAFASGGLSLAALAVEAAATTGVAVIGGVQAYRSYERYSFEVAARESAFGRAHAIGSDDPSLFWLALDIAFAVVDVGQAINAFRRLMPAARSIMAVRAAVRVGETAESAEVLARFRSAAESQAAALGQGDEFVERLMRTAEDMLASPGAAAQAQARRQLSVQTELLRPDAPGFQTLLDGDRRALQNLLREYGSWERLQHFLNAARLDDAARAGGDVAAQFDRIGGNLVLYRNEIINELQQRFDARALSGASSTRVSDVDLSTYGLSAGEDVIRAEAFMFARFGANWEEALRMNFYTDASRLAGYALDSLMVGRLAGGAEELPALLRGMGESSAASLLGDVAGQTRVHAAARQLAYAPAGSELAQRILADVPEHLRGRVRQLAGMSEMERLARRNALLRAQDDVVRNLAAASDPQRPALIRELSLNQIELNFFTYEASIAPGAIRQIAAPGATLAGLEAVGAVESHFADAMHILHESGGDIARAGRRYELYKYIRRFAQAARQADAPVDPRLAELERIAEPIARRGGDRSIPAAMSEVERERVFNLLADYYFDSIGELRARAAARPHEWGSAGELGTAAARQLEELPTARRRYVVPLVRPVRPEDNEE